MCALLLQTVGMVWKGAPSKGNSLKLIHFGSLYQLSIERCHHVIRDTNTIPIESLEILGMKELSEASRLHPSSWSTGLSAAAVPHERVHGQFYLELEN